MDGIDRIARLLAGGVGRRSLLAGLLAATVGTKAAKAQGCNIPECQEQCPGSGCGKDPNTGRCYCIVFDCPPDMCRGAGDTCFRPSADHCGIGGNICRACKKGKTCRKDGTCRRKKRRPKRR